MSLKDGSLFRVVIYAQTGVTLSNIESERRGDSCHLQSRSRESFLFTIARLAHEVHTKSQLNKHRGVLNDLNDSVREELASKVSSSESGHQLASFYCRPQADGLSMICLTGSPVFSSECHNPRVFGWPKSSRLNLNAVPTDVYQRAHASNAKPPAYASYSATQTKTTFSYPLLRGGLTNNEFLRIATFVSWSRSNRLTTDA